MNLPNPQLSDTSAATTPQTPIPQLQDIHQPDPVGLWPPAPGWWLLAAALLIFFAILIRKRLQQHRATRYRRRAREELSQAWQDYQSTKDGATYLQRFNAILKRTALVAYPRERVAGLTGVAWLAFLDNSLDYPPDSQRRGIRKLKRHFPGRQERQEFSAESVRRLINAQYQPQVDAGNDMALLQEMGLNWIDNHRRHGAAKTTSRGAKRKSVDQHQERNGVNHAAS